MAKLFPISIRRRAASGGSGGGPAFSDGFSINIKAADSNLAPADASTFQINLLQADSNAAPGAETVRLRFPAGSYGDTSPAPTDLRTFTARVWLSGSAGAGTTNPANANGQNNGALATLTTVPAGTNPITLTSVLGPNVPAFSITSAIYRGWFRSENVLVTSSGRLIMQSTTALFADIEMFLNDVAATTVDRLDGSFTFDLFAAGVNTLARIQSCRMLHRVQDAAGGVTPHILTVDAGCIEIVGAFT